MGELAYGPIQLRIAKSLTILPFLEAAAIPGLFIGCIIGNFVLMSVSSYGIIDIVCGNLITLGRRPRLPDRQRRRRRPPPGAPRPRRHVD